MVKYIDTTNNYLLKLMNWPSFVPNSWKQGTLKTFVTRAFQIFLTDKLLEEEIKCI